MPYPEKKKLKIYMKFILPSVAVSLIVTEKEKEKDLKILKVKTFQINWLHNMSHVMLLSELLPQYMRKQYM